MKFIILILSVLVSLQSNGQNWNGHKIFPTKKYPFEYQIQFENKNDTSSYKLNKNIDQKNSNIKLFDNEGTAIIAASITFKDLIRNSVNSYISDFDGESDFILQPGNYLLEISAMNYKKFKLELYIEQDQNISIHINLGLGTELDVYQVNSKTELNRNQLIEIKECIRSNRNSFYKACSQKKAYKVIKQI